MDRVDTEVVEGSQTTSRALISRRTAIGGAIGGALVTLLARPELATAQRRQLTQPADLVLLLRGLYKPVVNGPDLGLSTVDVNDGSYTTTKIYPVFGTPGHTDVSKAMGDFYASDSLCAYDIPGGAIAMKFTPKSSTVSVPDGSGGKYIQGTWELKIPEATGEYRSFVGGHNRMVDSLHHLASGDWDEFCVCLISRP
jgi:hypothetical protein